MSWCNTSTMKSWKQKEHRAERKLVKDLLSIGKWEYIPHPKEYGNEWCSPRDGKMYYGSCDREDIKVWNRK